MKKLEIFFKKKDGQLFRAKIIQWNNEGERA